MRLITLIISSLIISGCNNNHRKLYDESEYSLVRVDSSKGIIGTRYFVNNYDTARKMQIDYWDNGKILAKGFTYMGKLDGKFEMYDMSGNLMEIDSFSYGREIYSKKYYTPDTPVLMFNNGKLEPFVSIDSLK